jgi:hypothetical protein
LAVAAGPTLAVVADEIVADLQLYKMFEMFNTIFICVVIRMSVCLLK